MGARLSGARRPSNQCPTYGASKRFVATEGTNSGTHIRIEPRASKTPILATCESKLVQTSEPLQVSSTEREFHRTRVPPHASSTPSEFHRKRVPPQATSTVPTSNRKKNRSNDAGTRHLCARAHGGGGNVASYPLDIRVHGRPNVCNRRLVRNDNKVTGLTTHSPAASFPLYCNVYTMPATT